MQIEGQQDLFAEFDSSVYVIEGEAPAALVGPDPPADAAPPLRSVRFRNFKSFSDFHLELGAFNVLAGPNNAGKSTILQGIDLAYSLAKVLSDGSQLTKQSRYIPLAMLPVASIRDLFYKQARRVGNQPVEASVDLSFTDGSHIEVGIRHLYGAANCRVVTSDGMSEPQLKAINAHRSVWVPSAVGIVRDEEYRTAARLNGLIGAGRTNEVLRNLILDLHEHHADRFTQIQDILEKRFGAHLGEVQFNAEADQFVTVGYDASGANHDLYSAGSGFVQILQLLTYVLRRDTSVVLLDEPDAHLHSNMQRLVVEVLEELAAALGFQVVLATHSKEIINFVDPSRLVFVEHGRATGGPGADAEPVTILRALGDIDNVDAFTLFKNKRCLFVEGKTDVAVLSRWARVLGSSAFVGDDRVVAISVGGADRFEHVTQLDVIEGLLEAHVESLELRDRDAMTDSRRLEVMAAATRPLVVWERDSIESYLLNPTVLARLIGEVEVVQGTPPTSVELEALLMELCDKKRDNTVDRVSSRHSDDVARTTKLRPTIAQANQVAREEVERCWADLNGRLTLVSGRDLLSSLRQVIQQEYKLSFGDERLADSFTLDDIPDEVKEALERVESLLRDEKR